MTSSSERSQGGQPIQEVALGLGEPEGPQGAHREGDSSGKGWQWWGWDGGRVPTAAVALLQGPSSHRVHSAASPVDLRLPLLVPLRRGPEGPRMCTPSPPRAPGEAGAGAGEGGSRASPAWGCSRDLSLSPALPGFSLRIPGQAAWPRLPLGPRGPPLGAQHLSRPEQGSRAPCFSVPGCVLRRDEGVASTASPLPCERGAEGVEEATTGPLGAPAESPPPSS